MHRFTRARDRPRLVSAYAIGDGVLQIILIAKKIKICPKIQRVRTYNFGVSAAKLEDMPP